MIGACGVKEIENAGWMDKADGELVCEEDLLARVVSKVF